jgi:Tol biopolymer transport system component
MASHTTRAAAAFPGSNGEIAFQSNRDHFSNSAVFEIYAMNPDGSNQTRLTFSGGAMPSWSPDGRKIAFSQSGGEIWVMNADGSAPKELTSTPTAVDISPTWSPDGTKIAFARYSSGNYDIWTMNADGSNPTNVTNNPAEDIDPSWQPGGSKIAFQTNRNGNAQIYTMNADGSGLVDLSNSPTISDAHPDWSPDGSKIAFDSNRDTPVVGGDVYVMNADGSGVSRRTTTHQDEMPAWSPDGTKIAFKSHRDFNDEIYVMNADGTGATRLTNNGAPGSTLPEDWFPSWQPITGVDTTPPVITVPAPITVDATSLRGAVVTYTVTATDPDDGVFSLRCLPASGAVFPIGKTTVTCTAVDTQRNTSRASFTVTVDGANLPMGLTWFNPASGQVAAWLFNGSGTVTGSQILSQRCGAANGCSATWSPRGVADINGDGHADVTWWNPSSGQVAAWLLNGSGTVTGSQILSQRCGAANGCSASWFPIELGDVNGDGHTDVMWWSPTSGQLSSWLLNGAGTVIGYQTLSQRCGVANGCSNGWVVLELADVNRDGHVDLMWWNPSSGIVASWLLNGAGTVIGVQTLNQRCGRSNGCYPPWVPIDAGDVNRDGHVDLMWGNPFSGGLSSWLLNGAGRVIGYQALTRGCGRANGCSQNWYPLGLAGL